MNLGLDWLGRVGRGGSAAGLGLEWAGTGLVGCAGAGRGGAGGACSCQFSNGFIETKTKAVLLVHFYLHPGRIHARSAAAVPGPGGVGLGCVEL